MKKIILTVILVSFSVFSVRAYTTQKQSNLCIPNSKRNLPL